MAEGQGVSAGDYRIVSFLIFSHRHDRPVEIVSSIDFMMV